MLSNISISSQQSTCIAHQSGKLVVESCCLQSTGAPGLEHLFTPITTSAAAPGAKRAHSLHLSYMDLLLRYQRNDGGSLSVRETKIKVCSSTLSINRPLMRAWSYLCYHWVSAQRSSQPDHADCLLRAFWELLILHSLSPTLISL